MGLRTWLCGCVAAALVLGLNACGRDAETGAAGSPDSAERVVVQPSAPDGPPAGSSGAKGSGPHTGASGGDVIPGTTGSGTVGAGSQQPGTGLHGGLGTSGTGLTGSFPSGTTTSAPMGAGPAGEGSPNTRR